jgi:hypothetical protein
LNAPSGSPARSASSASAKAVSGVASAGFKTTVQPAASAGATFLFWSFRSLFVYLLFVCGCVYSYVRGARAPPAPPACCNTKTKKQHDSNPQTTTNDKHQFNDKQITKTLRVTIENGKFHGVIAPTTPTGCLKTSIRRSEAVVSKTRPATRRHSDAAQSTESRLLCLLFFDCCFFLGGGQCFYCAERLCL